MCYRVGLGRLDWACLANRRIDQFAAGLGGGEGGHYSSTSSAARRHMRACNPPRPLPPGQQAISFMLLFVRHVPLHPNDKRPRHARPPAKDTLYCFVTKIHYIIFSIPPVRACPPATGKQYSASEPQLLQLAVHDCAWL